MIIKYLCLRLTLVKQFLIIEKMLAEAGSTKCVVVTHFPPPIILRHPTFDIDMITSYFIADCTDIIEQYQPAYSFYGHNHWSSTAKIGNTTLMSNQFGYPKERWNTGGYLNPNLFVEIEACEAVLNQQLQ